MRHKIARKDAMISDGRSYDPQPRDVIRFSVTGNPVHRIQAMAEKAFQYQGHAPDKLSSRIALMVVGAVSLLGWSAIMLLIL